MQSPPAISPSAPAASAGGAAALDAPASKGDRPLTATGVNCSGLELEQVISKRSPQAKSSVKSVNYDANTSKWLVRVYENGKQRCFGRYPTQEAAETAAAIREEPSTRKAANGPRMSGGTTALAAPAGGPMTRRHPSGCLCEVCSLATAALQSVTVPVTPAVAATEEGEGDASGSGSSKRQKGAHPCDACRRKKMRCTHGAMPTPQASAAALPPRLADAAPEELPQRRNCGVPVRFAEQVIRGARDSPSAHAAADTHENAKHKQSPRATARDKYGFDGLAGLDLPAATESVRFCIDFQQFYDSFATDLGLV